MYTLMFNQSMNPSNIKSLNGWLSYHIYTNFGHSFVLWMERNPLTSSFIAEYTNIFYRKYEYGSEIAYFMLTYSRTPL